MFLGYRLKALMHRNASLNRGRSEPESVRGSRAVLALVKRYGNDPALLRDHGPGVTRGLDTVAWYPRSQAPTGRLVLAPVDTT